MRSIGVIPARLHSTRLPGKPLIDLCGKPMIQWVYEQASRAGSLARIMVATDDRRVVEAVNRFGGEAVLTASHHRSGTDRVGEIAARYPADVYVNIQGDEPLISPSTIDRVCQRLWESAAKVPVATARVLLHDARLAASPHVVKVVADQRGRALYFSRAAIPHGASEGASCYKHLGIYAYRREFLLQLNQLRPSALEAAERLEQLRFLDNGFDIHVETVSEDSIGVDTPEDVELVRPMLENRGRVLRGKRNR